MLDKLYGIAINFIIDRWSMVLAVPLEIYLVYTLLFYLLFNWRYKDIFKTKDETINALKEKIEHSSNSQTLEIPKENLNIQASILSTDTLGFQKLRESGKPDEVSPSYDNETVALYNKEFIPRVIKIRNEAKEKRITSKVLDKNCDYCASVNCIENIRNGLNEIAEKLS